MYKTILVPIDGSATAARGLIEAVRLAKACGATIRLLHVVNEAVLAPGYLPFDNYGELLEALRAKGKAILTDAEALARAQGVLCEQRFVEVFGGHAADSIIAESRDADLIVMGTHGRRGLIRLAIGSDAETVLRHALVPILLVRNVPDNTSDNAPDNAPDNA